mmetsp:Transcript_51493/g.58368  ORF Transcript_51493/g.58368 Transcript_51493/m.58368 type:complete len:282 (+) Transcript_51493:194-1039(+)
MVKYEHTYEATPAMIAVPFSKSLSSPASISMLRTQSGRTTQVVISSTSSLDPTIEDVETIISESPTDVTEDEIIREGSHEDDDESRESAPPEDADEKEKEEKDEEDEKEQHDNENEKDNTEAQESQEFVPHRVDGHTYHEAAMLGLNGTPTTPNANNKNKKNKDGTSSLASELGHSLRGSMQGLKRENSMSKEIKKPTSQAAASAADDNRTTAAASSATPPANTTVASAPEDEKDDFVPYRADGHTYFEAAMLGLHGTPTAATTGKKKKKSMFSSFFGKKK